jgi:bacterioferritin (cytochrome b1)
MTRSASAASVDGLARCLWGNRLLAELESAQRFAELAPRLRELNASETIVAMVDQAAADELRHADSCRELIRHFGGVPASEQKTRSSRVAPPGLEEREAVLYELVALSCVTETLSTALLGELVERARDPLCRRIMRSFLRDEVNHSRLGWAFLAEESARGARDCVGAHLSKLLDATLGDSFFSSSAAEDPRLTELVGLGSLELSERQRIVRATLEQVVFPGLERFGIETTLGRRWLNAG